MPGDSPSRGRLPASMADILRAQDEGARSYTDPAASGCPYSTDTARERFLREQWARGRALARVQAMADRGLYE